MGFTVLALAGLSLPSAWAQTAPPTASVAAESDQLEEVIVTAERRTEDVQKTGISVAVRNGDELLREGKDTLATMLEDIPGVEVTPVLPGSTPSDNNADVIVIRGVVPNVGLPGDTSVSTTAVYTDGIYGGIGGDYDIDRLEVLRGPQGTLYGRSATSGVVATYTRDPVLGTWGGNASVEYGSYALQRGSAAVNIPVGDQIAVRVAGNDIYQDGFLGYGGAHQESAGRIKLLYEPTSDVSLLLGVAIQADATDSGGPAATLTAPNTILVSPAASPAYVSFVDDDFRQYWAKLTWNLGFATLTYEPALRTFANDSPYYAYVPGLFLQKDTENYSEDQIHTEELRLTSNPGSALSWIAGAWFYERLYDYSGGVLWEPSGAYSHGPTTDKHTTNAAGYGEATYPIQDSLRVTAGLRFDYTRIASFGSTYTFNTNEGSCGGVFYPMGDPACSPFNPIFSLPNAITAFVLPLAGSTTRQDNVTFRARLEKDLAPTNMLYGMISSGFLPADLAIGTSGPSESTQAIHAYDYAAERLVSYEVGSKNRFLDNKLQINGDIFYYDYSGYQTIVNISGGGPSPDNVTTTSPARMFGAEIESEMQLTADDRVGLSAGYTDARFVDKSAFFATWVAETKIPGVEPLTIQARYDHRFDLPGGSSLDAGMDGFFISAYDESVQSVVDIADGGGPWGSVGSEVIGNAHLTWVSSNNKYSVTGYVRNFADNVYKTLVNINGYAVPPGVIPPAGTAPMNSLTPSAPRVFGVVLHATF